MYEARLYPMSNSQSLVINGAQLPWEPGLYGNLTGNTGGYDLDSESYRGVAYASCEYKGEDMFATSTNATANTAASTSKTATSKTTAPTTTAQTNTNSTSKTLYHLVLIGEVGAGKVEVFVKTQIGNAGLVPSNSNPKDKVYVGNETVISYVSNATDIETAVLDYTADSWNQTFEVVMNIQNRTCNAAIPKQKAGTLVEYQPFANDTLMNTLSASGNFTVKNLAFLNVTAAQEAYIGQNITVCGILTGAKANATVLVQLSNPREQTQVEALTLSDGSFNVRIPTNGTGTWLLQTQFAGDQTAYPCYGDDLMINVKDQPFFTKNGMFIGGGGFFGVVALALGYYIKKRRQ